MFKKTLAGCSVALCLGMIGGMPSAMADDLNIYLDVPYNGYDSGLRYRHYEGYPGYYGYRYRRHRNYDYDEVRPRLSCRQARRLVRSHGFYNVAARECEGRNYTFSGFRNGRYAIIYVNSVTGRVWRPRNRWAE